MVEISTIEPYRELWKRENQDNKELREIIEYKEQKIERLNNIINELELTLKDLIFGSNNLNHKLTAQIILMRLKELKGDDKE